MNESPFSYLVTAASDAQFPAERLVRAALLVARASDSADMAKWCSDELGGYEVAEVPEYRVAAAVLMATDAYGRDTPVRYAQASTTRKHAERCPLLMGLAQVAEYSSASAGAEFQVRYTADVEAKLLKGMRGAHSVFRLVQRSAFAEVLSAVRHHVFSWAVDRMGDPAPQQVGIDIRAVLGLRHEAVAAEPIPLDTKNGIDFSNAQLTGPVQIVVHSPGASASLVQQHVDTALLEKLVCALAGAVDAAKASGHQGSIPLEANIQELRALGSLTEPRPGWIKESLKTLRTVAEGASGSLLAELSKPEVQGLLSHVFRMAKEWN